MKTNTNLDTQPVLLGSEFKLEYPEHEAEMVAT
jgi:hypothetical protein